MTTEEIEVKGGHIFAEFEGDGLPVILIHAGYLDSRMWDSQFHLLKRQYMAIRYDVRGFGKSSDPDVKYSDGEDLRALMDHLGVKKAVLIGVSNGGRISLDFSVVYPERVAALMLVDFGIRGYKSSGNDEDKLWDTFKEVEERYAGFIEQKKYREAASIDVNIWTPLVKGELRDKLVEIATENVKKQAPYKEDLQVSPSPPAFQRLDRLTMPVLMILGDHDVPGQIVQVRRVHEMLKGSELVEIEDADHIPSLSSPEKFDGIMENFLREVDQRMKSA